MQGTAISGFLISLVSASKWSRNGYFSSWSRLGLEKSFYGSLGLVSVSKLRKIFLGLGLDLEISTKPGLGLVSVSPNVVSSNSGPSANIWCPTPSEKQTILYVITFHHHPVSHCYYSYLYSFQPGACVSVVRPAKWPSGPDLKE